MLKSIPKHKKKSQIIIPEVQHAAITVWEHGQSQMSFWLISEFHIAAISNAEFEADPKVKTKKELVTLATQWVAPRRRRRERKNVEKEKEEEWRMEGQGSALMQKLNFSIPFELQI